MFKDVKDFDAQNPVIGSLIIEVDIDKKKDLNKFLDKAHDVRDLEIQSRLNKLHKKRNFFNGVDGSSSNKFFHPPPLPPASPNFPNPTLPPLSSYFFRIPKFPRVDKFLNNNDFNFDFSNGYDPPAPDPRPLRGFARNSFPNRPSTAKTSSKKILWEQNTTQTMIGDHLIGELESVIEKEKLKEEIVPDENIIFTLPKILKIHDNEDFEIK